MGERVRIELVNSVGQVVYNTEVVPDRGVWSVDVWLGDNVANGLYMLRLNTGSMRAVRQVMIQR